MQYITNYNISLQYQNIDSSLHDSVVLRALDLVPLDPDGLHVAVVAHEDELVDEVGGGFVAKQAR